MSKLCLSYQAFHPALFTLSPSFCFLNQGCALVTTEVMTSDCIIHWFKALGYPRLKQFVKQAYSFTGTSLE